MAWSPLGGGRLPGEAGPLGVAIGRIMKDTGLSPEQVALAWLLKHPAGIQPVIGSGRIDRVASAARTVDFELSRQQWFALLEAAQGHPVP